MIRKLSSLVLTNNDKNRSCAAAQTRQRLTHFYGSASLGCFSIYTWPALPSDFPLRAGHAYSYYIYTSRWLFGQLALALLFCVLLFICCFGMFNSCFWVLSEYTSSVGCCFFFFTCVDVWLEQIFMLCLPNWKWMEGTLVRLKKMLHVYMYLMCVLHFSACTRQNKKTMCQRKRLAEAF